MLGVGEACIIPGLGPYPGTGVRCMPPGLGFHEADDSLAQNALRNTCNSIDQALMDQEGRLPASDSTVPHEKAHHAHVLEQPAHSEHSQPIGPPCHCNVLDLELTVYCSNVPDAAKLELESFLLEWCRRHTVPSGPPSQASSGRPQPQAAPASAAAVPSGPSVCRLWSGSLSLTLPLTNGSPGNGRLAEGQAGVAGTQPLQTQQAPSSTTQGTDGEEGALPAYTWEDRLRPHAQPLERQDAEGAWRRRRSLACTPLRAARSAEEGSLTSLAGTGTEGLKAGDDMNSRYDGAGLVQQQRQQPSTGKPNFTARIMARAASASAAVAFNNAYEQENGVALYDRLRVAPLRLGAAGLAASAMPLASAAATLKAPSPTHGSEAESGANGGGDAARSGEAAAPVSSLLAALGPLCATGMPGPAAGAAATATATDGSIGRSRKRRRTEGQSEETDVGLGAVTPEFRFVLNRCWNCGSYGHDLQTCFRPRDQASIDTHRRAYTESRAAAEEQRAARMAATAERQAARQAARKRTGGRGAAHNRYFSQPADEETTAAVAACGSTAQTDADAPLTVAPPWVRPGMLSAALATALELASPLHPPPWLSRMALHGLPPAYTRAPADASPLAPEGLCSGAAAAAQQQADGMQNAKPGPEASASAPPRPALIRVYGADGVPLPLPGEEQEGGGGGDGDAAADGGANGTRMSGDAAAAVALDATMDGDAVTGNGVVLKGGDRAGGASAGSPSSQGQADGPQAGAVLGGAVCSAGEAMPAEVCVTPAGLHDGLPNAVSADMDIATEADTALAAGSSPQPEAGTQGTEAGLGLDSVLVELLPAAPRHVAFPGINAPIPSAACREAWGKALLEARRAVAVVTSLRQRQGGMSPQPVQPVPGDLQLHPTPQATTGLQQAEPPQGQLQAPPGLQAPQEQHAQVASGSGPQQGEAGGVAQYGWQQQQQQQQLQKQQEVWRQQQQQQQQQQQHVWQQQQCSTWGQPQAQQRDQAQQLPQTELSSQADMHQPQAWHHETGLVPLQMQQQQPQQAQLPEQQEPQQQPQGPVFVPQAALQSLPQPQGLPNFQQQHMQAQLLQRQQHMFMQAQAFQQQMHMQRQLQMQNGMFVFRGLSGPMMGAMPGAMMNGHSGMRR